MTPLHKDMDFFRKLIENEILQLVSEKRIL